MRVVVLVLAAGCGFTRLPPLDHSDAAPGDPPDGAAVTVDAPVPPPDAAPDAPPAATCQATQLVASRTYGIFPIFTDATLLDLAGKTATLPATLAVTAGNGANRCARITFQTEAIGTTQCLYK